MHFILDQNDKNILNYINILLKKGKTKLRSNSNKTYRYEITGFNNMNIIKNYFKIYPLKTKKLISYNKFYYIHKLIMNKEHLTIKGLNKIKEQVKQINKNNNYTSKIGNK